MIPTAAGGWCLEITRDVNVEEGRRKEGEGREEGMEGGGGVGK